LIIVVLSCGSTKNQKERNQIMSIQHVSLSFAQLPDAALDEFTGQVIAGLTGNAAFPTPTVSLADLGTAKTAFEDALTAMTNGGKQATAAKDAAREALVNLLRQEANYVQGAANNDLAVLLSSGFQAASNNRTQTQLTKPSIQDILNEISTQLVVRGRPVANARAYEAQVKNGTGGFVPAGTFTKVSRMVVSGLTPGQTYTVQIRAVGGSTGYSDWSDPVSHMAM
jgi:hypothetical protein